MLYQGDAGAIVVGVTVAAVDANDALVTEWYWLIDSDYKSVLPQILLMQMMLYTS